MKLKRIAIIVLTVASVGGFCTGAVAALNSSPTPMSEKAKKTESFHGKVQAVDTSANTLTVAGKVYSITADTKLSKEGKTITLGGIAVGDQVHGLAKEAGGKSVATKVMVLPAK